jgi:hypothetical protein
MHKIIYVSEATGSFDHAALEDILAVSRQRNDACGLTGLLLYYPERGSRPASFLQVLEGRLADIEETYWRISQDVRHQNVTLLSCTPMEQRIFGDWTMGLEYVTEADLDRALPGSAPRDPSAIRMRDLVHNVDLAELLLVKHLA